MADAITAYLDNIHSILDRVAKTQKEGMEEAARWIAEATLGEHNVFAFGCSHAGLLAFELYYRTGGMATINPVRAPGLHLDVDPATLTSQIERLEGYGRMIVDALPLSDGDVLLIHSVSGRNTVSVDVALRAREKGAKVIALTNMETTTTVRSRHPSGKNLYEVADLVLDNCGCRGDSSLILDGVPEKVAPTSTAIGAAMLNAVVARAVERIVEAGGVAPVFVSANLDEGDEHNRRVLERYKHHIFYMD
ncbi:MAG TPA: SIS domain-containing protein [Clostridia bacterium]|nr:SIS domain-containing protein [Clostridia bacterium]